MSKKDEFKLFVSKHPKLIKYVENNEATWQKFFEIYSLYGESDDAWNKYLNLDIYSKHHHFHHIMNIFQKIFAMLLHCFQHIL